jgi:NADPH2 dehydrogenase
MSPDTPASITKIASLRTTEAFQARLRELNLDIPVDPAITPAPASPLALPMAIGSFTVGNRWVIHPMEGWDATPDGCPSELLVRRWQRFGQSGAKLLWGMEAVAVTHEGRANPNQLILRDATAGEIAAAADQALETHRKSFGTSSDLLWGLQLTHSGRFCRPNDKARLEPRIAYRHPILDRKFKIDSDAAVLSDDDVRRLIDSFVEAARLCAREGIPFVDVKQCHGYLLHEFLSARTRSGPYGGEPLENRTRAAREIIEGIRQVAPKLIIGVRLSAFDLVPFRPDPTRAKAGSMGPGIPEDFSDLLPYRYGFGVNADNPTEYDLAEPIAYLKMLQSWGVSIVNISCGSPYYNPHIQRPALYPPSDGYQPACDPLIDVHRIIHATRKIKAAVPTMPVVSTGLTYLQEFLPQVGQALVREGWTDLVGMGRMVLSYPRLIADSLEKGALEARSLCRTLSDCTSGPRNGLVSGCYPLDPAYRERPENQILKQLKREAERRAHISRALKIGP